MDTSYKAENVATATEELANPQTETTDGGVEVTSSAQEAQLESKKAETKGVSERINKVRQESLAREKAANEKLEKLQAEVEFARSVLSQNGYKGEGLEDMMFQMIADAEGGNVDDIKTRELNKRTAQKQRETELIENNPIVQQAREVLVKNQLAQDLAAIKAAYPDVQVEDALELGETYVSLMATGKVDALTAYAAQRALDEQGKRPTPPSSGEIGGGSNDTAKDFYTPSEAKKLTQADYDKDPTLFERVRKSMYKWK